MLWAWQNLVVKLVKFDGGKSHEQMLCRLTYLEEWPEELWTLFTSVDVIALCALPRYVIVEL